MMSAHRGIPLLAAILAAPMAAPADTVTMRGAPLPLDGCDIVTIRGGQIVYDGPAGRRRQPLEDIAALGFDELPALDEAEEAFAARDYRRAVRGLLRAMLEATTDEQRIWIHARLVVCHDALGQFVQAAGHAGAVFAMEDHPWWKRLEPMSEPDRPPYPAAREALENLRQAERAVRSAELKRIIEKLLPHVRAARTAAERDYEGPQLRRGATISGFTREEILALANPEGVSDSAVSSDAPPSPENPLVADAPPAAGGPDAPDDEAGPLIHPMPAEEQPEVADHVAPAGDASPEPAPRRSPTTGSSSDDLESLLAAGEFDRVAALCGQRLEEQSNSDPAGVLHAWGRALLGLNRPEDAAVVFTRCAILHPATIAAARSLRATARIYETVYHRADTARRLLGLAVEHAEQAGDHALAEEIRAALRRERR